MRSCYRKIYLPITLILLAVSTLASEKEKVVTYRNPLDLALSLSGSYGELRATHFHSGVDFRIGGVSGARLYAAADGYVSRISVSPGGYGHAIYIDHPDGRTTLYGHMMDFAPNITRWVREQQYLQKDFSVNLYPEKSMFPLKKGDFIGRAGNTGSSGGPHLHFEVRESSTQIPLNPLKATSITVVDNIPPEFRSIGFYGICNHQALPSRWKVASHNSGYNGIISLPDTFYVAVDAIDRQNGTNAKLAVYQYNYYLDDTLVFSFTPEKIPFDAGRYINSIVEYSEKSNNNISMVKSWVEPGGGLASNIRSVNDGLFILRDNLEHKIRIELKDEHGNTTNKYFRAKRSGSPGSLKGDTQNSNNSFSRSIVMPWFIPNRYHDSLVRLMLPPAALYSSIEFSADTINVNGDIYHMVHNESTPLHNPAILALKVPAKFAGMPVQKLMLVKLNKNGRLSSAGGTWRNGWVEGRIGSFGIYGIATDTIPPVVTPLFANNQNLSGRNSLRFTVKDNLSGISSYNVWIDGIWILTSYDPKNSRLESELMPDKLRKGVKHDLEIEVKDNKGNTTVLKRTFIW